MSTATKQRNEQQDDTESIVQRIDGHLDDLQSNLPTIPAKWLELNRAAADRTFSANRRNYELLMSSIQTVAKTTDTGIRTVVGTVVWTTEKSLSVVATGVRTIVGQTKAQAKIAAETVTDEIEDLTDEAIDRVEAADMQAEKRHLRSMTKAELYGRAQVLDIDGRADMSKAQLVNALAAA